MNHIKLSASGKTPQFKHLLEWKNSGSADKSILTDYIAKVHPNAETLDCEDNIKVFTSKGYYSYQIRRGGILRTNLDTQERKLYKIY
jgi:hypothetical protein